MSSSCYIGSLLRTCHSNNTAEAGPLDGSCSALHDEGSTLSVELSAIGDLAFSAPAADRPRFRIGIGELEAALHRIALVSERCGRNLA